MPNTEDTTTRSKPVLLIGAGRRPRELGAVLAALGTTRTVDNGVSGLESAVEPHRQLGLSDLEELLSQRPREGTLLLDTERVPGEDVGFVRRFLERHPEWRLVVLGEDRRQARSLLDLPRSTWLNWPRAATPGRPVDCFEDLGPPGRAAQDRGRQSGQARY